MQPRTEDEVEALHEHVFGYRVGSAHKRRRKPPPPRGRCPHSLVPRLGRRGEQLSITRVETGVNAEADGGASLSSSPAVGRSRGRTTHAPPAAPRASLSPYGSTRGRGNGRRDRGTGGGGVDVRVYERLCAQRRISRAFTSDPLSPQPPPRPPLQPSAQRGKGSSHCSRTRLKAQLLRQRHDPGNAHGGVVVAEAHTASSAAGYSHEPVLEARPPPSNRYFVPAQVTGIPDKFSDKVEEATPVVNASRDARELRTHSVSPAVQRLYTASHNGQTAIGKRVLHWATHAGLDMVPHSQAHYKVCLAYGRDPKANVSAWRHLCVRGRVYFAKRSICTTVGGQTARSADISLLSGGCTATSTADGDEEKADGNEQGSGTPARTGAATLHGKKPPPFRVRREGESLRAYRKRLEYARWCRWQLRHFYEQGFCYLTSVWRHVGRADLSFLVTGRFVVPTDARINGEVSLFVQERRKARFLHRMLLEEFGLVGENGEEGDGEADQTTEGHDSVLPDQKGSGNDMDDELAPARARRVSDALMSQEPFVDVSLDTATGLLEMTIYVNGTEDGDGATFLSKCTAGCIDNFRWCVLSGVWRGRVLFFIPRQSIELDGGTAASTAQEGYDLSLPAHGVEDMQFLLVDGVCLEKLRTADHQAATSEASDMYLCRRCGQLRRRGRVVDDFHTGADATAQRRRTGGFLFCRVCCRRSAHVLVTREYVERKEQLGRWVAACEQANQKPTRREAEAWLAAFTNDAAGEATTNGRRRRPRWATSTHVDASRLLGYIPPLSSLPPPPPK